MDGQPLEPGAPLPLLARIGRARKPAEATATRASDGRTVNIWATLGSRDPRDVLAEDRVTWRPVP